MRILHVITSLRAGGAEKLMVDLLPRIKNLGNDVSLLVFDGIRTPFTEQLEESGVPIYSFNYRKSVYDPRIIYALFPFLKQYDIVHTHNTACQFFVAIAKTISHASCSLITTEHSTSNRRRGFKLFKPLDNWMYHQYKSIICVSKIAGENICEYVGDKGLPICIIPNGIDYNSFYSAEPAEDILNNYQNVHRSVMVAGFRYEKDQPTVIKAFALLPEQYHLFLVGDGERRQEFEQLVRTEKCADRIHFLGIRSNVPALLKASDVVIMSSHREGLSLSSLEGMASGRPFVASDVDGLHEVVFGHGELFPHENSNILADIILRLSEDMIYARQVAERCYARASQFDISIMAEKYISVYKS